MKSDNSRYYEILRVRKSASEGELKKAYKLAAVELHPDKGGDPEKFNQYGEDPLKEGMGGGGDDGSDPFGDVFDSLSGGNHPSGALRSQDGSAFAEDHHEGDESKAEGVDGAAEEVDEAAEVGDEAEYRGYTGSSDSEDGPERVVQLTQRSSKLSWIAKTLFLVQALGLVAIVAGVMIYERLGLLPGIKIYHTPLVFSILTSCTVALCVLHSIVECPSSLVTLFQWAPSCCLVTGFHLLTGGTNASIGYFFLTIGFAFTAYVCHKYRSLTRGAKLVTAAIKVSKLSGRIFKAVYLSLAVGGVVCCLCTIALSAPVSKPLVYRIVLIASLMWCMEVIHNVMVVAICRVMYLEINGSLPRYGKTILGKVLRESLGEVALAALVPMLRAACSAVRLLSLLVPSATQLVHWLDWCWRHYSLWGLAAVGLHRMTIFRGSFHMYKLFESKQTLRRVRSDVTESLSLLWSLFGGSVGASVAGGMVNLSVGIKDITMIMIYGFLLGFQLTRVVMSWPTGAVIAYHVRNAERVNLSEQQLALNMEAGSRNQIGN